MKKLITLAAIVTIILIACNDHKQDNPNSPASTEETPPAATPTDTTTVK